MLIILLCLFLIFRIWRNERELKVGEWRIKYKSLQFYGASEHDSNIDRMRAGDDATSAYLNGARVTINQLATKMKRTKRFYLAMKTMVEFDNNNLATFLGVCTQPTRLHIVWEHCEKGSIYEIINTSGMEINIDLRMSIVHDITKGLEYIHHSPMKYHGNLTSKCCVIDHEWRGKITDFGMRYFTDGDWKVESVEDDHTLCHKMVRCENTNRYCGDLSFLVEEYKKKKIGVEAQLDVAIDG